MKFTNSLRTSLYTTVGALLLTLSSFAQAPEKMSYQAVIRGANNALVTNQQVGMQISILQGSTAVYEETQTPTSNTNGLVSLEIGTGTVISGSFTAIDWSADTYFIKTETDPTGGTNYTITGTSQLLSVPFALYAKTSSDAGAVAANTAKVGYTEELVSANTAVAANTAKVGYTDASVSANTDVAANTAKVGYTEAAVTANTSVAANTAKVGYTEAAVTANTSVAANTLKVSYSTTASDAVALNTAKVGYTEALVSANTSVAANTAKKSLADGTTAGQMQYWNGTLWVTVAPGSAGQVLSMINGVPTWGGSISAGTGEVQNPTTGAIWMDRNLGASQVATSSTDTTSYGDLYQWGRGTDGHQIRTSGTTATLSSTDNPGDGNFIKTSAAPYDWRSPQNTNLWQGVNGVNNPCPSGYRLPTETEWEAERATWSSNNNAAGAFASPLKLPVAGGRVRSDGSLYGVGTNKHGYYWSSTVSSTSSLYLYFSSSNAYMLSNSRAVGHAVRCLK